MPYQSNQALEPGLIQRLPQLPEKVVLLRASRIGDFLNAVPAFKALRAALPRAEIHMITLPVLKDIVERCIYLDKFIPFPGFPGLADQFFNPRQALKFFAQMQAEAYDLAIQMQGSGVYSNPMMLMLGARYTAGFAPQDYMPGLLDAALQLPQTGTESQRILALTTFLGAPSQGEATEFPLWPEDREAASELLTGLEPPFIAVHSSARDLTRRWQPQRFVQAAQKLQSAYGGTLVWVGESWENEQSSQLLDGLGVPYSDLSGKTTLPVLGAILSQSAVFLTNDTGPAHIAYALNVPTVAIFGGGDPNRNGPPKNSRARVLAHPVPCRPCDLHECPIGYICLENISVEQVTQAAAKIIRLV